MLICRSKREGLGYAYLSKSVLVAGHSRCYFQLIQVGADGVWSILSCHPEKQRRGSLDRDAVDGQTNMSSCANFRSRRERSLVEFYPEKLKLDK